MSRLVVKPFLAPNETHPITKDEVMDFCGKAFGMCYLEDDLETIELEAPEEIGIFVDLKSLLTSFASFNADFSLQYDASEDFSSAKYAAEIKIDTKWALNMHWAAS